MKRTLRLVAPYLAVGIFWCLLSNAWLAVARDIAFVAVGFVIIFVQLFLSYRKLSTRSF